MAPTTTEGTVAATITRVLEEEDEARIEADGPEGTGDVEEASPDVLEDDFWFLWQNVNWILISEMSIVRCIDHIIEKCECRHVTWPAVLKNEGMRAVWHGIVGVEKNIVEKDTGTL